MNELVSFMPETSFTGLVFKEAVDFLQRRLDLPSEVFLALVREVDAAAQDRALGMKDSMVRSILEAVVQAIRDGESGAAFRGQFDQIARANGWTGDNSEGWRSALTFNTLTAQAMAAGRWRQIQQFKAQRPYLRYVTAGDHRVREAHRQWHGVILPVDHPWWHTHFPPNGFNCRCRVQSLSDYSLKRYGEKVSDEAPPDEIVLKSVRGADGAVRLVETPKGIDPGFGFNAGEVGLKMSAP
jgi:SPP1 gp7 family putative phage head morphogenesis protein